MSNPRPIDDIGQPTKRQRLSADQDKSQSVLNPQVSTTTISNLELCERLCYVMLCNVCREVPHPDDCYQCTQGHIICDDCVTHILAEATLSRKTALCPHCRVPISWQYLGKNLIIRQAIWELPKSCPQCDLGVTFKSLAKHMVEECEKRAVNCQYSCLGCDWQGEYIKSASHEASCNFPSKSGEEILRALQKTDSEYQEALKPFYMCHQKLSAQRLFYENVQICWQEYSTTSADNITMSSYAISAFNEEWLLKLRFNKSENEEVIKVLYVLRLMTPPRHPLTLSYFAMMPPGSHTAKQLSEISPKLYKERYTSAYTCGQFRELPVRSVAASYRLIAMPVVSLRLWMFLH